MYEGPPDHRTCARHSVYPELDHDEIERFNFLAQVNGHLSDRLLPAVKAAWRGSLEPSFFEEQGRRPKDRREVRETLLAAPVFQTYSALRRMTMEQRQEAGRWAAIRQAETLVERVAEQDDRARLTVDPAISLPRYLTSVDHHCMPGSYHAEIFPGDVSGPANYDSGIHVTLRGRGGPYHDAIGTAMADWIRKTWPNFKPRRIVDVGATIGHNALPIAQAFPEAEVIAIDICAPVLRYGSARAAAIGVENISFLQADAAKLDRFDDGSIDLITSAMFLHELSGPVLDAVYREAYRLLTPGGLMLNMEQPAYSGMSLFEQTIRDWDALYNNEPFWTALHSMDRGEKLAAAGFARENVVHHEIEATGVDGETEVAMIFEGARK